MKVYVRDSLPWDESMLIFHSLGYLNIPALNIVSPQKQFVSVGYFQDPKQELNMEYIKEIDLPIFRREIGGGTTLLDYDQIFYHLILPKGHPLLKGSLEQIYKKLSEPPIEVYRMLGIETKFKPINDIITLSNKKIAGEGAADIGESFVFVGSIILDFDFDNMVKVFNVPDEKFRDKIYKSLKENMSTVKRELGLSKEEIIALRPKVQEMLIQSFERLFGEKLEHATEDETLRTKTKELKLKMCNDEFIFQRNKQIKQKLRIRSGLDVRYGMYKAPGGLIRAMSIWEDGAKIHDMSLTGDFTLIPHTSLEDLEEILRGAPKNKAEITNRIKDIFFSRDIQAPGIAPEDITQAIFSWS